MSADDGKLNRYRGPPVVTAAPIPKMKRSLRFTLLLLVTLLIPLLPFAVIGELPGATWLSARDDNALTYGLVGFRRAS